VGRRAAEVGGVQPSQIIAVRAMTLYQPGRLRRRSLDKATRLRQDGRELSLAHSLHQLLWNHPDYLKPTAHFPRIKQCLRPMSRSNSLFCDRVCGICPILDSHLSRSGRSSVRRRQWQTQRASGRWYLMGEEGRTDEDHRAHDKRRYSSGSRRQPRSGRKRAVQGQRQFLVSPYEVCI
jgi:hypothetical protein